MNAYETMLYHGILLRSRERVDNVMEEEEMLSGGTADPRLGYVYNLASNAKVTQPKASLIVESSVAKPFEELPGWIHIPIENVEFVSAPLNEFSFESTVRLRLSEIWPEDLIMSLPRVTQGDPPRFKAFVGPNINLLLKEKPMETMRVELSKTKEVEDVPCDAVFYDEVPAFSSGLSYVFTDPIWRSIEYLFPERYWLRRSFELP